MRKATRYLVDNKDKVGKSVLFVTYDKLLISKNLTLALVIYLQSNRKRKKVLK